MQPAEWIFLAFGAVVILAYFASLTIWRAPQERLLRPPPLPDIGEWLRVEDVERGG